MVNIELQLQMDCMQHMLHPPYVLRVWRARSTDILAELPMTLLEHIITEFLTRGVLAAASIRVQAPTARPRPSAPAPPALRAVGVPERGVQAARRAARAARKRPQ